MKNRRKSFSGRQYRRRRYNGVIRRLWDGGEVAYLIAHYPTDSRKSIGARLDRTAGAVSGKAHAMDIAKYHVRRWTKADILLIKKYYLKKGPKWLANKLNSSFGAVRWQASRLKIIKVPRWSKTQLAFLKRSYPAMQAKDIAATLGMSVSSVSRHIAKLGIQQPTTISPSIPFTERDKNYLRRRYGKMPIRQLAHELHRSEKICRAVARDLNLTRPAPAPLTAAEQRLIKQNCQKIGVGALSTLLHRPKIHITRAAQSLGVWYSRSWSKKDIQFIKKEYKIHGRQFVASALGKTLKSVQMAAIRYHVKSDRFRRWTKEEDTFLRRNLSSMTTAAIGKHLHRSTTSVQGRKNSLGLEKAKAADFSQREIRYILKHYRTMRYEDLAAKLGRSINGVYLIVKKHGVLKTAGRASV